MITPNLLGFTHRFVPSPGPSAARTLLTLHGTGGDESQLLGLAAAIDPAAHVLSPRGKVSEFGAPRFFRRLAEGVFDVPDLIARANELADFVALAADAHHFDPATVVAVGFSNGANVAAAMMLLRPHALAAAVLLRPMVPLRPDAVPDLAGRSVLIVSGEADPIVPRENVLELAGMLGRAGAAVTHEWLSTGHGLVQQDVDSARAFLDAR